MPRAQTPVLFAPHLTAEVCVVSQAHKTVAEGDDEKAVVKQQPIKFCNTEVLGPYIINPAQAHKTRMTVTTTINRRDSHRCTCVSSIVNRRHLT